VAEAVAEQLSQEITATSDGFPLIVEETTRAVLAAAVPMFGVMNSCR
jgi:hypothetical protein